MITKYKNVLKKINKLAIPGLMSSIISTIFTVADEAIVGRTNVDSYTAVSISANLIYLLIGNLGVLSVAFAILFAKSIGEKNKFASKNIFNSLVSFSIILGVIIEGLALVFGKPLISAIYGVTGNILNESYLYLIIASLGVGLNLVCFIMSNFFKNLLKPKISLITLCVSLPINFVTDYILVFGKFGAPKLGGSGSAIGTVLGVFAETVLFIIFFIKEKKFKFEFRIDKDIFKKTLKLFFPLLGQDFVECTLSVMLIGAIISRYNTVLFATYSVINAIIVALTIVIYSYAGATMTLVGQEFAAEDNMDNSSFYPETKDNITSICNKDYAAKDNMNNCKMYPSAASLIASAIYLIIILVTILFPDKVCGMITDQYELLENAIPVVIIALTVQLLNIPTQMFKYALQAIGKEKWVFIVSFILSMLGIAIMFVNVYFFKMGLTGVFAGFGILYLSSALGFYLKYNRMVSVRS